MNLTDWKKKMLEVQDGDCLGSPYILPDNILGFEWAGCTYGCMAENEDPFMIPPSTAWLGVDRKKVKEYNGPPIDWNMEVPEDGVVLPTVSSTPLA